jgi:hypothetical protein
MTTEQIPPVPKVNLIPSRHGSMARLGLCLLIGAWLALAQAQEPLTVQLYDTGSASRTPWSSEEMSKKDRWTLLPEDKTNYTFKGDAVFANGKLAVVLRRKGRGAEVYTANPQGFTRQAELVGSGKALAVALSSIRIAENNPSSVALDATFKTAKGGPITIGYELKLGQAFVQTQPRSGAAGLQVIAPCRFAVLPDFFADDIVADATALPVPVAELPSENFLMHLTGQGDAIVMPVWHPATDDVRVTLTGQGQARTIASSEIHYAPGGKICVAVLTSPGIWHERDIANTDTNQILRLGWKAPYAALWRVDWQRDDKLVDSWEMLTQKPDGEFVKHGWYGQPDSFGNVDWSKTGRGRWTTVLGKFLYPCWIDNNGEGYLQPLAEKIRFQGPALIYPINRVESTPLEEFTIVDIMRATLGVGPCEYILDIEGQKKTFQGRPTCASRTILNEIYSHKEQKAKREEVEKTLDEVIAFVRHIRGRIEDYAAFSHDMVAWLEEQKKTQPQLADNLSAMQATCRKIDESIARRKDHLKTPEYATQLVDDFRANLVDYEGTNALSRCKHTTAALVDIGGNQDELVGECRMTIKRLRQQAALLMAADPRLALVAREVRRRTQQMLRNPTSYEAPRH